MLNEAENMVHEFRKAIRYLIIWRSYCGSATVSENSPILTAGTYQP